MKTNPKLGREGILRVDTLGCLLGMDVAWLTTLGLYQFLSGGQPFKTFLQIFPAEVPFGSKLYPNSFLRVVRSSLALWVGTGGMTESGIIVGRGKDR